MTIAVEAELEAPPAAKPPSALALLFSPDREMDRQARAGRAVWFLLFAWLCALLLGAVLALRVDAHDSTIRNLSVTGRISGMSDRQIADETRNAERVFQVASVAKAVVGVPFDLGLACLAILFLVWFFRGRVTGSAVAPVAAATLIPGALANLLDAFVAFRHTSLPPEGFNLSPRTLSAALAMLGDPVPDPWVKLGNALDFFSLWAAVMLAFGVIAAGQVPKRTAIAGTLVAWLCCRLITQVAMGG